MQYKIVSLVTTAQLYVEMISDKKQANKMYLCFSKKIADIHCNSILGNLN